MLPLSWYDEAQFGRTGVPPLGLDFQSFQPWKLFGLVDPSPRNRIRSILFLVNSFEAFEAWSRSQQSEHCCPSQSVGCRFFSNSYAHCLQKQCSCNAVSRMIGRYGVHLSALRTRCTLNRESLADECGCLLLLRIGENPSTIIRSQGQDRHVPWRNAATYCYAANFLE